MNNIWYMNYENSNHDTRTSFKNTLHFFSAFPICRGFFPKACKVLLGSYEEFL